MNGILMSCINCKFHDVEGFYKNAGSEADGWGDVGYCRRMPPLLIASRSEQEGNAMEAAVNTTWPVTDENDWCGEFQAKA